MACNGWLYFLLLFWYVDVFFYWGIGMEELQKARDNYHNLQCRNTFGLSEEEKRKLSKEYSDAQRVYFDLIFMSKKNHDRGSEVGVPMSPEAIEAGNRANKKYQEIFGGMVGEKSNEEFEVMP